MVRAPCCDRMGLKKGPWTQEEDQILISYIQRYGHGNWRALPKQAGLLRCGKSCRLRWMNYLRPDIKRGNFSKEEEEAIISLHELLGNRWSAIAAKLPGRTDNEIKNVWHTHLKKRVKPNLATQEPKKKARCCGGATAEMKSKPITMQLDPAAAAAAAYTGYEEPRLVPASPQQSCSELSSTATDSSTMTRESNLTSVKEEHTDSSEKFLEMDESFWSDALSLDNSASSMGLAECAAGYLPFNYAGEELIQTNTFSSEDDMDFWLRIFMEVNGDLPRLPSS